MFHTNACPDPRKWLMCRKECLRKQKDALGKKRLKERINVHKGLVGRSVADWVRLLSVVASDRTRSDRNRLKYREFSWTIRKKKKKLWGLKNTSYRENYMADMTRHFYKGVHTPARRVLKVWSFRVHKLKKAKHSWQSMTRIPERLPFHCWHSRAAGHLKGKGKELFKL